MKRGIQGSGRQTLPLSIDDNYTKKLDLTYRLGLGGLVETMCV